MFYESGKAMTKTSCNDANAKVVSQRLFLDQLRTFSKTISEFFNTILVNFVFKNALRNGTLPRGYDVLSSDYFAFAVEESICAPEGIKMIVTMTTCSTDCGCGTQTVNTRCVYETNDNHVPKDSSDYQCCPEEKTIQV